MLNRPSEPIVRKEFVAMTLAPLARACALVAAIAALSLGLAPRDASAQDAQLSIMTGSPSGTYIQFGRDMSGLMEACGQPM